MAKKKTYLKKINKKKHEAGWLALLKIGIVAFLIFVVLALVFGYAQVFPFTKILASGLQVAVLVIILIIFIIGLITVSENTSLELKCGKCK